MELFVVRHAEAALRETWNGPDADRPLTRRGRKRFGAVVDALSALDVRFDRVVHSPWLRAVETADRLARLADGTEVSPFLAEPPSDALLEALAGERVAAVGHEPWLSELVAWLVTGERGHAAKFSLDKGGVAWLVGAPEPGGMALAALLPGRVLRKT